MISLLFFILLKKNKKLIQDYLELKIQNQFQRKKISVLFKKKK
jgi:hypothetical protein